MTLKEKLLTLNVFEDNEYLDKYVELIESNRNTKREKFKTQRHHIVPKFYFKLNGLDIDNSRENLINLVYKDHVLAHLYMSLCSSTSQLAYNNFIAIQYMLNKLTINDLDELQELYELGKQVLSNNNCMYNTDVKENHLRAMRSEQVRTKISQTMKSKYLNGELFSKLHRENISISQKDLVKLKKDNKYIMIKSSEIQKYLDDGWVKGWVPLSSEHKQKLINSHLGKKYSIELRHKLSESHKGQIPWNKGKIGILSQDTRDKISNTIRGSKWMNNGEIQLQVKKYEIDDYINKGFTYGRLSKKRGGDVR